jgi:hypothetical protein
MLNRPLSCATMVCAALLGWATPAAAQQTLNVAIGAFAPLGADARTHGDVLIANRNFLDFNLADFRAASIGVEWLVPIGRHVEGGIGVGFSRRTVPSVYEDYIDSDGTEIDQDLRLRLVPVALTLRVLPLGQSFPIQPYLGGGLGVLNWRYSESGEFVDFGAGRAIFRDSYVARGSEVGPVVLGGVRVAGDSASAGGEIRWQKAEADLDNRFAGPKLDLGGWTYSFTIGLRF